MLAIELDDGLIEQCGRIGRMRKRRNSRDGLERGGDRDTRSPHVRNRRRAVGVCQRQYLRKGGKAAADRKIRLDNVDATSDDEVTEAVAREVTLAAGDR